MDKFIEGKFRSNYDKRPIYNKTVGNAGTPSFMQPHKFLNEEIVYPNTLNSLFQASGWRGTDDEFRGHLELCFNRIESAIGKIYSPDFNISDIFYDPMVNKSYKIHYDKHYNEDDDILSAIGDNNGVNQDIADNYTSSIASSIGNMHFLRKRGFTNTNGNYYYRGTLSTSDTALSLDNGKINYNGKEGILGYQKVSGNLDVTTPIPKNYQYRSLRDDDIIIHYSDTDNGKYFYWKPWTIQKVNPGPELLVYIGEDYQSDGITLIDYSGYNEIEDKVWNVFFTGNLGERGDLTGDPIVFTRDPSGKYVKCTVSEYKTATVNKFTYDSSFATLEHYSSLSNGIIEAEKAGWDEDNNKFYYNYYEVSPRFGDHDLQELNIEERAIGTPPGWDPKNSLTEAIHYIMSMLGDFVGDTLDTNNIVTSQLGSIIKGTREEYTHDGVTIKVLNSITKTLAESFYDFRDKETYIHIPIQYSKNLAETTTIETSYTDYKNNSMGVLESFETSGLTQQEIMLRIKAASDKGELAYITDMNGSKLYNNNDELVTITSITYNNPNENGEGDVNIILSSIPVFNTIQSELYFLIHVPYLTSPYDIYKNTELIDKKILPEPYYSKKDAYERFLKIGVENDAPSYSNGPTILNTYLEVNGTTGSLHFHRNNHNTILDVEGDDTGGAYINLKSGDNNYSTINFSDSTPTTYWNVGLQGDENLHLNRADGTGNVVIPTGGFSVGTDNPNNKFYVEETASNNNWLGAFDNRGTKVYLSHAGGNGMYIEGITTGSEYLLQTRNSNSDVILSAHANGHVGIGTDNPSTSLEVSGNFKTINSMGNLYFYGNNHNTILDVEGDDTGGAYINLKSGDNNYSTINFSNSTPTTYWNVGLQGDENLHLNRANGKGAVVVSHDITSNNKQVPVAEEKLRIIRGVIDRGDKVEGNGFTVNKHDIGVYTVYFDTPFSDVPTVTATCVNSDNLHADAIFIVIREVDVNYVAFDTYNDDLNKQGAKFHFIAIGQR